MASVEKRDEPGRKTTWLVRYRDANGVDRKKSFKKKSLADAFRTEIEHSLRSGTYVDPAKAKQKFETYAEDWFAIQSHSENYMSAMRSHLRTMYPIIGHKSIGAIKPSEIQAMVKILAQSRKPASVRTILQTAKGIFRAAHLDLVVPRNPCVGIKLPAAEKEQVHPLTEEQVQAVLDLMPKRYQAVVLTAALAGLRQGEVFGLRVSQIQFLRKSIRVDGQVQPLSGGVRKVSVKTDRWRTVPVDDGLLQALSEHIREYPTHDDGFIFTNTAGRPLHRRVFDRVWARAREKAAEQFEKLADEAPDVEARSEAHARAEQLASAGFHELRHFYASALIHEGLNVVTVAARLGHSDPAMTLRVYSHLWPGQDDRTRDAMKGRVKINPDVPRLRPAQ